MDISKLDRQGLLDYIESLEAKTASLEEKMEDLKAQVDVLNMDMDDFKVPDEPVPELRVSEQTADALAEAASIFDDFEVEPAPVENGVVKLGPVTGGVLHSGRSQKSGQGESQKEKGVDRPMKTERSVSDVTQGVFCAFFAIYIPPGGL